MDTGLLFERFAAALYRRLVPRPRPGRARRFGARPTLRSSRRSAERIRPVQFIGVVPADILQEKAR